MSVDAGSPLAREWAREEIKKLGRLDAYEAARIEDDMEGRWSPCDECAGWGEFCADCQDGRSEV